MKVKVKAVFVDKFTKKPYKVGEIIDVDKDRAKNMIDRGLATSVGLSAETADDKRVITETETPEEVTPVPKTGKKRNSKNA